MSALPQSLCSTYSRYKEDNSKLATWLVENVQLCGHKLPPTTHPPKLKGRERTLAHRAQKEGTTKPSVARISVDNFQKFAAIIANSNKPKVEVPQALVSLLRRLISARKKCNAHYAANTYSAEEASSNATHWYFIGILERVLELLSPLCHLKQQLPPKEHTGTPPGPDNKNPLSDPFEELNLQEQTPRDPAPVRLDDLEGVGAPSSEPPNDLSATVEVEALPNQEDVRFRCLCVLNDLQDIRANLQDLWLRYKTFEVPLITACLKTDAAFRLARDIENEFSKQFGQGYSYAKMFRDVFFKSTCSSEQQLPGDGFSVKGQYTVLLNSSNTEASEQCFLQMWCVLNDFHRLVCCSGDECKELEKDLPRLESLEPDLLTDNDNFAKAHFWRETIMLVQNMRAICWYMESDPSAPDQFYTGLRELAVRGTNVPLWMAFSSRVYLDINDNLGDADMTRPLQELDAVASRVKTVAKKCLIFLDDLDENAVDGGFARSLSSFVAVADNILNDDGCNEPARVAFSGLPVSCVLAAFHLLHAIHTESLYFTDCIQSVIPAAHLLNALAEEQAIDMKWADMDELLRYHSRQHGFVGEPPTSIPEYKRHLALAAGVSATNFCPQRRDKRFKKRSGGPRKLSFGHTQLTRVMMRQFEVIDRPPEGMEKLALLAWVITQVPKGRNKIEQDRDGQVHNMPALWKAAKGLMGTPPVQVLDMLELALSEEVSSHYYDYFGVTERSWQFLHTVMEALNENGFRSVRGTAVTDYEAVTSELFFWLDRHSSDFTGRAFRTTLSTGVMEDSGCDVLAVVADSVSEYLSENRSIADVCTKAADPAPC